MTDTIAGLVTRHPGGVVVAAPEVLLFVLVVLEFDAPELVVLEFGVL